LHRKRAGEHQAVGIGTLCAQQQVRPKAAIRGVTHPQLPSSRREPIENGADRHSGQAPDGTIAATEDNPRGQWPGARKLGREHNQSRA